MKRIAELDGLRGIAVLGVIAFHYMGKTENPDLVNRIVSFGGHGVELFFVLSGFLIGGILLDNRGASNYYQTFYYRRIFRILPLSFLTTLVFAPMYFIAKVPNYPWHSYFTFTQNFYQAILPPYPAMGYMWSLAMEEQFYFVLPFIIRKWPNSIPGITVGSFILGPLIRLAEYRLVTPHAPLFLPFGRVDILLVGVLIAFSVRNELKWFEFISLHASKILCISAILEFSFIANGWISTQIPSVTIGVSLHTVFFGSLLLTVVTRRWQWLGDGALPLVGRYSYCMYLIHLPIISLSRAFVSPVTAVFIATIATFLLPIISWEIIESPLIAKGSSAVYRFPKKSVSLVSNPIATDRPACNVAG